MSPRAPAMVLVVDDEDPVRTMVCKALEFAGYAVDSASNGAEALERIDARRPDAIVLDLMMPVMDGWSFVEACRAIPRCWQTPIVVTSAAHGIHQIAERLRGKGVRAVLAKPFDIDALFAELEPLIGGV